MKLHEYTIHKNTRYGGLITDFRLFTGNDVHFSFSFDEECWYPYLNNDSHDLNKLFGFSKGFHREPIKGISKYVSCNSYRLGWVPDFDHRDTIVLHAYQYNNGQRISREICRVQTGRDYDCGIILENNKAFYLIRARGEKVYHAELPIAKNLPRIGYLLHPYFGGNNKAPRDMKIYIDL